MVCSEKKDMTRKEMDVSMPSETIKVNDDRIMALGMTLILMVLV